jgi:hypothetical protein
MRAAKKAVLARRIRRGFGMVLTQRHKDTEAQRHGGAEDY